MGDQWFAGTIVQLHPTCLVQMDGVTDDQLIVLDLFDEVRKLDEQPLVNFFQTSTYILSTEAITKHMCGPNVFTKKKD